MASGESKSKDLDISKKITFVSEGSADIDTQKAKEQQEQKKFEDEKLRRNRKSLRDQLRSNAISKQKEFKSQVRKSEKFNRLNKEELKFFNDVKQEEEIKENEMEEYLEGKTAEFERKRNRLKKLGHKTDDVSETVSKSVSNSNLIAGGIVKKKKKKLKVKINLLESIEKH